MTQPAALQGASMDLSKLPTDAIGLAGVIITGLIGATGLWRWIRSALERERELQQAINKELREELIKAQTLISAQGERLNEQSDRLAVQAAELARTSAQLEAASTQLKQAHEDLTLYRQREELLKTTLNKRERQILTLGGELSDPEH